MWYHLLISTFIKSLSKLSISYILDSPLPLKGCKGCVYLYSTVHKRPKNTRMYMAWLQTICFWKIVELLQLRIEEIPSLSESISYSPFTFLNETHAPSGSPQSFLHTFSSFSFVRIISKRRGHSSPKTASAEVPCKHKISLDKNFLAK